MLLHGLLRRSFRRRVGISSEGKEEGCGDDDGEGEKGWHNGGGEDGGEEGGQRSRFTGGGPIL